MSAGYEFEQPIAETEALIAALRSPERRVEARAQGINLDAEIARLEEQLHLVMKQVYGNLSPWAKVQMARHKDRPYSLDYVRLIFDDWMELAGDRLGHNDEAVIGGTARLDGRPVVVIGQQKGRDLRERQRRNFGSARAEGFRKALRLARMAEKFGKPLISFVDTAGAAADLAAEDRGVSEAIARNLAEFAYLETPIVVVVIGEGGSGGALGMAVGDRVHMLEHAVYSVISPEGCAAILWKNKERADEAAAALRVTAADAKRLGLIDSIIAEPLGGAHRDPVAAAGNVKSALLGSLAEMAGTDGSELVRARCARIRRIGVWEEEASAQG